MDPIGLLEDLADKSVDIIFTDFMTRYAKHEALVVAGERFLRGFYRELEMLGRDSHFKASGVVDEVIKANYTDKLKEYVEAGFINRENAIQNISKFNSCKLGLEDHLIKAKVLLDELESLKHNAIDVITHSIEEHFSDCVFNSDDTKIQESCSAQEDAKESLLLHESMSRANLMTIIYGMLKLEFTMQEKIIRSLNLKTSSSVLESYCLFWELRPDIDDNVLHQAWKYVSGRKG